MSSVFERIAQLPRISAVLGAVFVFLASYLFANQLNIWGPWTVPLLPGESAIPFIAWTTVIYISAYVVSPLSMFFIWQEDFARGLKAFVIIIALHTAFFIIFPTQLPRAHRVPVGFFGELYRATVAGIDRPQNCFPSEHVALAVLTVCMIWRRSKKAGFVLALWAFALSISTLTVKQHYALDVLGGFITGLFAYYCAFYISFGKIKVNYKKI